MKVIVGVGIPGSGKSTYLKPMAHRLGMAYINPDTIREELTGDMSDHSREPDVWESVHTRLGDAIRTGRGAVVDATYTKRADRRELLEVARANGAEDVEIYWFDCPLDTALVRNRIRSRHVPEPVVRKMYNRLRLNPPLPDEGFDRALKIAC